MPKSRSRDEFRALCEATDYFSMFCRDGAGATDDIYEDDGALHVRRYGVRAVFEVNRGQDESGATQNQKTREVLAALGIKLKNREAGRAFVDEIDENDPGYCPHCGEAI
jgi:hypothetical protein